MKRPCATSGSGQGLLSLTLSDPSLVDLQLSDHGAGVGGLSEADAAVATRGASSAYDLVTSGAMSLVIVPLLGRGMRSLVVSVR